MNVIRAKAPLRISFGGGGTDVYNYFSKYGGKVINATIDKYAYTTIYPNNKKIRVTSFDLNVDKELDSLENDGNLDLIKAVFRTFNLKEGTKFLLHSDAPVGSGLGASSSVVVSLIGAISRWKERPLTNYQIAEIAYKIEREDMGILGGYQDQFAATFGGFNYIEFEKEKIIVNPLKLDWEVIEELNYRTVIAFTGSTRVSGGILKEQITGVEQNKDKVLENLHAQKELAKKMKDIILLGKIDELGELLDEAWSYKRNLAKNITNQKIDKAYETAKENGAIGGKILGAGGGGYLLLIIKPEKRKRLLSKLKEMGLTPEAFSFEEGGLRTWKSTEE